MLRSSAPSHPPLYREIIRESLSIAWHERHLWILAILAGLIQTGGIYDVLFRRAQTLNERALTLQQSSSFGVLQWIWQPIAVLGHKAGVFFTIARVEGLIWALLIGGGIIGLSIIAQGALVYGLGIRLRGEAPRLRACFAVGARSFWKVAAVNIVAVGLLWALGTLLLLPFATPLVGQTWWTSIGAIIGFTIYLISAIILTAIHMLALPQVVLQKTSVVEGLERAAAQVWRGWLTILELGAVFFALGVALFIGLAFALFVAGIPLILFIFSSALLGINSLSTAGLIIGAVALALGAILAGAFAITVQYSAWQRLSIRLAQGTAIAKFHRFFHGLGRSSS